MTRGFLGMVASISCGDWSRLVAAPLLGRSLGLPHNQMLAVCTVLHEMGFLQIASAPTDPLSPWVRVTPDGWAWLRMRHEPESQPVSSGPGTGPESRVML